LKLILFVLDTRYLPGGITGANVSLHALCRRLQARGWTPVVIATPYPGPEARSAEPLGYRVLRTNDPDGMMHEMNSLFAPAAIVLRGPAPAERIAARAAAARAPRLHVYFESAFFRGSYAPPHLAPNLRYAACSPYLARMAEAFLGTPVDLVPPLIEPDGYRCDAAGDSVLFVNPTAVKGVHIAEAIAARLPHRRFLFVRSWPEHPNFPHRAPAQPNIRFAESTGDMRALFAQTRLVLMPSISEESWGRVVSEAQISGIPAVASDRGALPETVGPGGVVLPLAAPIERWCDAVERAFSDPACYAALSEGARRHAARPAVQPAAVVDAFLDFVSR